MIFKKFLIFSGEICSVLEMVLLDTCSKDQLRCETKADSISVCTLSLKKNVKILFRNMYL